jgi:hypothetical protein
MQAARRLELITDDDHKMTMREFIDACELHAFINYDGFAHPVIDEKYIDPNITIRPSDVTEGHITINHPWTHIIWYNR